MGHAGANGANGTNGATGPTGRAGVNGTNGATGAQGPIGDTGPQGPQGPQGDTGASGSPAVSMLTGRVDAVPGVQVNSGGQSSGAGAGKAPPTAYGAPSGTSTAFDLADVETLSPSTDSFLAQNLAVQMTGPGVPLLSDDSVVVNLVVNGTAELSCTIPAGSSTCESSGVEAAIVAPGSTLAIQVTSSAPPAPGGGESTDQAPQTIPSFDLLFGFEAVGSG